MTLYNAFNKIMEEWSSEINNDFKNNKLAFFIKHDFKKLINDVITEQFNTAEQSYSVNASAGKGNWANVPWLSILNPNISCIHETRAS